MSTIEHLLGIYKKPRISFKEVCDCIGIAYGTGRIWRSKGKFPVPMTARRPLSADLRDVAAYMDETRPT
nr:hypothetical protein [uncultured Undibacterium sp.]